MATQIGWRCHSHGISTYAVQIDGEVEHSTSVYAPRRRRVPHSCTCLPPAVWGGLKRTPCVHLVAVLAFLEAAGAGHAPRPPLAPRHGAPFSDDDTPF